ncbi:hypothetical protein RCO27_09330 [Sphingosinicella sp. LHD-64]|uniref:hypothetical protein n=1 Tax=Sphingosinicella sp. LHD-64 TaxID=3072139 RepID=UPI00280F902F|nr:hypothetical protein [Sphingosinicella sp. LHD-64]MDQ8756430.1 hypothetical protein [Sphingosinicella sp. LHD-64]
MKTLLTILGVLALLMGLLWMGQGTGLIRWPAESFMIDTSVWTLWGGLLALCGAALIWLGRRGRNAP